MKFLSTLLSSVFIFFLNASLLFADDCRRNGTPFEELKRATLVFSGKIVEINRYPVAADSTIPSGASQDVAKFKVDKWWKGGGNEVNIPFGGLHFSGYSARTDATLYFKKDEEYLIYAYGKPFNPETNNCTRTIKLSEAQQDLAALPEGVSPKSAIECPRINIRNRILDSSTGSWVFEASVLNIDPGIQLEYKWWYFIGNQKREIKSGQNTSKIIIENADTHTGISAFVLVEGISAGCNNSVGIGAID